ncbi:TPA: hypothetical protein U2L37_001356 [Burkholderia multivorans]|uniref:hypothetical protein n=1 Tax=Burkholderia multivorans TaxID=87883 RepID=UPI0009E0D2AA|nr:hypothetical protein [Burkholderia multivorans]SAK08206.1 hypothetical protein UA14_01067 [Burkholderia multivorans]HEM7808599.1 hypothetical protein [Burkholderia multivorans]HEM7813541.1 hypothetical protein [Burkholderia multivorans]HEM7820274.1 hypothetical protein [Burkholderia multivorans]HEM7824558.1 hypothetical protein [Burkholderia multivorans]
MNTSPNVRTFAPEFWGEVDKFTQFYGQTHDFKPDAKKAVSGVKGHFNKALTLRDLAAKLAPNLKIDSAELQEKGFTGAVNAQEFSAVIEEVFTELYSSIDCARKVIVAIYKHCQRIPDSTRKLFLRAANGEIGGFPPELQAAFVAATWYVELRDIRDELTHSNIGSCHQSHGTNEISYMHQGLVRNAKPLVIPDVFKKIDELFAGVNHFLGHVFNFLNKGLKVEPTDVVCGFFHGRCYIRRLAIADHIDFNSGVCQSNRWFDAEPAYRCPFASSCGAYARASQESEGPFSGAEPTPNVN